MKFPWSKDRRYRGPLGLEVMVGDETVVHLADVRPSAAAKARGIKVHTPGGETVTIRLKTRRA